MLITLPRSGGCVVKKEKILDMAVNEGLKFIGEAAYQRHNNWCGASVQIQEWWQ